MIVHTMIFNRIGLNLVGLFSRKKQILILLLFVSSFMHAQFTNTQKDKIDILHYDFQIKISDTSDSIFAVATETILLKQTVDLFYLQLKNRNDSGRGMSIGSVETISGTKIFYKHQQDKIVIYNPGSWREKDTLRIKIIYSGVPEDGLYIKKNKYGKRTFFGDNWPNRAQYWLPVLDHPSDKASVDFHITAPQHYEVIASGILKKITHRKDFSTHHFQTKVSYPTKVMVFAAADFNIKNYSIVKLFDKCIPVSSWIFEDTPIVGFDDYKCSINVLKFYDSLIGSYNYQKLSNIQSKTRFGGMENAGNIFYYENSADGTKSIENLVAHEVAHQWFGNAVSEKNWKDIWLSEGFATYLTDIYLEHKYGIERLKQRMRMERKKVIRFNKSGSKPVVYMETRRLFNLLNPNSYEKGAWVLHMLRTKMGDKKFFELLKRFYAKYRNRNASTKDFIVMAENISGQSMESFFGQWLFKSGLPELKLEWKLNKKILVIDIQQVGDIFNFRLSIKVSSDKFSLKKLLHVEKEKNKYRISLPAEIQKENIKFDIDPEVKVLFQLID